MNTREAKCILRVYRPGGEDAGDPLFAEALAETGEDPALAEWFAKEIQFDSAIGNVLKKVKVPDELRESVLIGKRTTEPIPWWRLSVWPGTAALFLIITMVVGRIRPIC